MPAKSKAQQAAAAMALKAKRGESDPKSLKGAAKSMYDGMTEEELEKFAKTKTKNLPDTVEECIVSCDVEVVLNGEKYLLEKGDKIRIKSGTPVSENLKYHIDNNIPLHECEFRIGSDSWCNLMNEARDILGRGLFENICENDRVILEKTSAGRKGIYKGKEVPLDSPSRDTEGGKKFKVYVNSGNKTADGRVKAKLIRWGDPNLAIKNDDPKAAKSFRARHKCSEKKDRKTAGWWACNVHRYAKQLGLSSSKPW
jgi:hypothetical protein